jgi:hypothetical protein
MRNENAAKIAKLRMPNHLFLEAVPRPSGCRGSLVAAGMYFSGMQQNDGKASTFTATRSVRERFAGDPCAHRREGRVRIQAANNYSGQWGCRQFDSGLLYFVSRIRDRRYVGSGSERGLVFGFAFSTT